MKAARGTPVSQSQNQFSERLPAQARAETNEMLGSARMGDSTLLRCGRVGGIRRWPDGRQSGRYTIFSRLQCVLS
jgi:hypothetical protein